jgi:hypothetical protein
MEKSYKAMAIKHLLVSEHSDYETDQRAPVVAFINVFV